MNKPYTQFFKSVVNAVEEFNKMPEGDRPEGIDLVHTACLTDKTPSGRIMKVKHKKHEIPLSSLETYWLTKYGDEYIEQESDQFNLVMAIRMISYFEVPSSVMMYYYTEGQLVTPDDEDTADQILKENGSLYGCEDLFSELSEAEFEHA